MAADSSTSSNQGGFQGTVVGWPAYRITRNPYSLLLYSNLERRGIRVLDHGICQILFGRYDLLHIHWPNFNWPSHSISYWMRLKSFFHLIAVPAVIGASRLRNKTVLWTVHNLRAHDVRYAVLATWYDQQIARLCHGYTTFSTLAKNAVEVTLPAFLRKPGFVVRHGHYRDVYGDPTPRCEARDRLGLDQDASVVLFAGNIRPYKDVMGLIDAFALLDDPSAVLVIAGPPIDAGTRDSIREALRSVRSVALLKVLSEFELKDLFGAADLFVCPVQRALSSGSILMSLSFGVPVLACDTIAAQDAELVFSRDGVMRVNGRISTHALRNGLAWAKPRIGHPAIAAGCSHLEWSEIAEAMETAMSSIHTNRR
jgi:glycosyltransferase involved in cell wall biosynthesis